MRYVVVEYVTGKDHPYMPFTKLYACKDLKTGQKSMGCSTKFERMKARVDQKNKELSKDIKILV